MMPTPTPFRAVLAWANHRSIHDVERELLIDGLRVIDAEFISFHAEKIKAAK